MTLQFHCSRLHLDGPVETPDHLIINYVGGFQIETEKGTVYKESDFPCVEFVRAASAWLQQDVDSDFEYDSMEAEEPGIVWFRASGNGWRIGSIHQDEIDLTAYSQKEIADALRALIDSLRATGSEAGLPIDQVLPSV